MDIYSKENTIKNIVHYLLVQEERCRNDNDYLYGRTLELYSLSHNMEIDSSSLKLIISTYKTNGMPLLYNSVIRARQHIARNNPELAPSDKEERKAKEKIYRDIYSSK